ncbi:hypothetical protein ES319_A05G192200v1 [Gossypium barbadense]|uniref:Uncharacterized protein n=1 Tax=Gossypium barbadense TaxID=3634 RepID=A0A5J5VS13_GOSBA|nr:hypothetical protein ES319_A05G192200v1 [Gossypium barbadense]
MKLKRNREETGEKERKKKKKENLGFQGSKLICQCGTGNLG